VVIRAKENFVANETGCSRTAKCAKQPVEGQHFSPAEKTRTIVRFLSRSITRAQCSLWHRNNHRSPVTNRAFLPGTVTRVKTRASHRKQTIAHLLTRNVPAHLFFLTFAAQIEPPQRTWGCVAGLQPRRKSTRLGALPFAPVHPPAPSNAEGREAFAFASLHAGHQGRNGQSAFNSRKSRKTNGRTHARAEHRGASVFAIFAAYFRPKFER
jgi:hypothetical protein